MGITQRTCSCPSKPLVILRAPAELNPPRTRVVPVPRCPSCSQWSGSSGSDGHFQYMLPEHTVAVTNAVADHRQSQWRNCPADRRPVAQTTITCRHHVHTERPLPDAAPARLMPDVRCRCHQIKHGISERAPHDIPSTGYTGSRWRYYAAHRHAGSCLRRSIRRSRRGKRQRRKDNGRCGNAVTTQCVTKINGADCCNYLHPSPAQDISSASVVVFCTGFA